MTYILCKSNKHKAVRYKKWCWCWKSICVASSKYKGSQFSSLLLRKITFPKSTVPFSHLFLSPARRGCLSQLASVCRLIQMDMASRPPVPHRPSGWTWLPGLQMGRRAPHLCWTLNLGTLTHTVAGRRLSRLSSISNHPRLNSGRFPSSYHHR